MGKALTKRDFYVQKFAPGIWAFGMTKSPNSISLDLGKWSLVVYKDEW
jgi:hypothetical protein